MAVECIVSDFRGNIKTGVCLEEGKEDVKCWTIQCLSSTKSDEHHNIFFFFAFGHKKLGISFELEWILCHLVERISISLQMFPATISNR